MKAASTGFFLCLSLCLDLGIVNLATLQTALRQGGTAGFLLGLGSCAGDMVYFSVAIFGATALLGHAAFRLGLWIFGTSALAFMVWRMIREVFRPHPIDFAGKGPTRRNAAALLAAGMGLALASPTAILWFAAVGGSVIASFGGNRAVLVPFALGFFAAAVLWAAFFSYSAAALRRVLGGGLVRALSAISAVLFLYFAGIVFFSGWKEFLR